MVIRRHSAPGKLDQAPKDTVCEVINDHKVVETYIQTSDDDTVPKWEPLEVTA